MQNITLDYHKIYEKHSYIEDIFKNIIYIPLFNKYQNIISYAMSDIQFKNILLQYKYHINGRYVVSNLGVQMHHIVYGIKPTKGFVIDHRNNIRLDNRLKNLQYTTKGLNAQNKTKKQGTTSNYIGVHISKGTWASAINYNNKRINLGSFKNPIDAAKIYDVYAVFYYHNEGIPKTNNLLSKQEINDIISNGIPKQYIVKGKIHKIEKHISKNKYQYEVKIIKNKIKYVKNCKTLAEALIIRQEFYDQIKKLELAEKKLKQEQEITRNSYGEAIIYMSDGSEYTCDDHVWHDISQYKWRHYINKKNKLETYATAYIRGDTWYYLHRYIYEKYIGPIPEDMTVDHIKSNEKMNVKISNLRLANKSLQAHNKEKYSNNFDKYKGVSFNGYTFTTFIDKKTYGSYNTAEEAAEKANEIFKLKYGNNAKLNNIDYSVTTTADDRIPEYMISKEFIMNISQVKDLKNSIRIKKLDRGNGGSIVMHKIKLNNMEEYKQVFIKALYDE